jgi:hypothetical protein
MKEKMSGLARKFKINEKAINFLLIFILGFLVGVAVKTEAKKRITIGYSDYLMADMKQGFDLTKSTVTPQGEPAPVESEPQEPAGSATQ